ncbi:MAG: chemotaxis protein CheW [Lysobacter sp.]|nr:chemotaxis protein CheW [Lysobacter sp.]
MLLLVFHLDRDRYAIEAAQVVSVLPLVQIKTIPQAPAAVAGLFDYRGELVPAIDLCRLALGRAEASGVDSPDAAYLGPVASDARGPIQLIGVRELLPESVRELLFRAVAAQA